jgi:hypothetical protein
MRHSTAQFPATPASFCRGCLLLALATIFHAVSLFAASPLTSEYLRGCGIGAEDFARLRDDRQVADEELDVIGRIAVRLRDCPADTLHSMLSSEAAGTDFSLPAPSSLPSSRGRPVKIRGRVETVEAATGTASSNTTGDFLWRCTLIGSGRPHRAVVYVACRPSKLVGETVAVEGLFLKYTPGVRDEQVPVIAAPRLQRLAVGPLGEIDFDAGSFDGTADNAPLADGDSGAFYHLLSLTKKADAAALARGATALDALVAARLFHDPAAERGRLFRVAGIARRVVQVPIDDPAMAARLGTDHYYELDILTEALQDNPLVFCTLELPRGMPQGGPAAYGEAVDVTGFFLKTWQYPAALTAAERAAHAENPRNGSSAQALQTAPLLIGPAPQWLPAPAAVKNSSAWVIGGVVVLAITGLALLRLSLRQSDQEFSQYLK